MLRNTGEMAMQLALESLDDELFIEITLDKKDMFSLINRQRLMEDLSFDDQYVHFNVAYREDPEIEKKFEIYEED
jgi:DNA polymerase III delta prime subunit